MNQWWVRNKWGSHHWCSNPAVELRVDGIQCYLQTMLTSDDWKKTEFYRPVFPDCADHCVGDFIPAPVKALVFDHIMASSTLSFWGRNWIQNDCHGPLCGCCKWQWKWQCWKESFSHDVSSGKLNELFWLHLSKDKQSKIRAKLQTSKKWNPLSGMSIKHF